MKIIYQIQPINSKAKLVFHKTYVDIEKLVTFNTSDIFIIYEKHPISNYVSYNLLV